MSELEHDEPGVSMHALKLLLDDDGAGWVGDEFERESSPPDVDDPASCAPRAGALEGSGSLAQAAVRATLAKPTMHPIPLTDLANLREEDFMRASIRRWLIVTLETPRRCARSARQRGGRGYGISQRSSSNYSDPELLDALPDCVALHDGSWHAALDSHEGMATMHWTHFTLSAVRHFWRHVSSSQAHALAHAAYVAHTPLNLPNRNSEPKQAAIVSLHLSNKQSLYALLSASLQPRGAAEITTAFRGTAAEVASDDDPSGSLLQATAEIRMDDAIVYCTK